MRTVLLGFALFGVFWGAWGAALPAVQERAQVGDAAFGGALLLIGAGALASMRVTGLLFDRLGPWVAPIVVACFGVCAAVTGFASSAVALSVSLFLLGALSGAFDVVINTAAVRYEAVRGRPLMGAAHAAFSAAVVVASALTGLARGAGAGTPAIFAVVGVVICLLAIPARALAIPEPTTHHPPEDAHVRARGAGWARWWPLAVFGGMCALANLVENAQQSWSARQLEVTLHAPPQISGLGPSVFALATVSARLASQFLAGRGVSPRATLMTGALLAAVGTAVTALAPGPVVCLAGVAIAGLGTGVCAPTIIGVAGSGVPAAQRGATVSTVMTIAYLGFAAGPALVGLIADRLGLREALTAMAGAAAILAVAAAAMPTRARPTPKAPEPAQISETSGTGESTGGC
ncbi:MFS transporter [Nonomuraea sediminis]|uniref:MFS transporter n=1 Tax=Nonomuraea sediminis TaxID=2835864 RepID=UPI001BDBB786|nr:MFS transporter [Nonomuraea sediminis]